MASTATNPTPQPLWKKHRYRARTSTGSRCEFLLAGERGKLSTIFSNYLSLGQFELARAIFQRLRKYNGAVDIVDTLISLGPPKDWLCSLSVPSSAHLGWLCMSLRQELIEDSRASSYSSNQLNGGQKLDVVDGGIPEWVQRQLELDILLTTALLDGAAYKWQSLSPKTVKVLRRAFFRSLARTIDVAGGEEKRTSRRIRECTQRNADRLPPLHVLPIPGFLPPVASYLSEETVAGPGRMKEESLSTAMNHVKELMLSQPLVGYSVWNELSDAFQSVPQQQKLLQGVAVQILAQCFHDGKYGLSLFFLRCLRPPTKNAAMDEGARDILTAVIDLLWDRKCFALKQGEREAGVDRNAHASHSLPLPLKQRLRSLAGPMLTTGDGDTQLLSYYCSIEDANSRLRLESVELPPCFTHFHQRLQNGSIGDSAFSCFWGDYFTLMWVTKQHCLEYVLENGLRFIQEQKFHEAAQLLRPFHPLKALVILLSIDHPSVADIQAKQQLVSALWTSTKDAPAGRMQQSLSTCSEPRVERWCDQLAFMVKLAWWYTDRYESIDSESRVPASIDGVWRADENLIRGASYSHRIANAVLRALETNSIVRVARECLPFIPGFVDLSALVSEEGQAGRFTLGLLQFLANRPRGTNDTNEEHQQDMMLLRTYYALKKIFAWFHDAVGIEKRMTRKMRERREIRTARREYLETVKAGAASVKTLLLDIDVLPIRLTALENVFALLFLRNNDLIEEIKVGESGDTKRDEMKRSSNIVRRNSRTSLNTLGGEGGSGVLADEPGKNGSGLIKPEDVSEALGISANSSRDYLRAATGKGHFSRYIASSGMLKILLDVLKDCLEDTLKKLGEGSMEELLATCKARTISLLQYVEDGIERVNVLKRSRGHFKRSSSQFMKRMFATPQSLLNVCLKRSDYDLAKRIIKFFNIPQVRSNEVMLAETLDTIAIKLERSSPNLQNVDMSFTSRLSKLCEDAAATVGSTANLHNKLHAFYISIDLAISAAPTIRQSQVILKHAQTILQGWKQAWGANGQDSKKQGKGAKGPDPNSNQAFYKKLFQYFSTFVIKRYTKLINNQNKLVAAKGVNVKSSAPLPPLWKLLKRVENMPIEPTILESHLSQVQSRVQALDNLRAVFDRVRIGAKGKASELKMESFLESVLEQFSQGNQSTTRKTSLPALASAGTLATNDDVEMQYLASFLTYIMEISNGVKSARAEDSGGDGPVDFLSILSSNPRKILSSLVLEFNGFSEARDLAKVMRIDLLRVLLRSCCNTSILRESGSGGGLTSSPSSTPTNQPTYPLNMKVVEYVATLERDSHVLGPATPPLLASLVCMQKWTNPPFSDRFVSYALEHTKHFPSLHRWVCHRAQAFSHLEQIFLEQKNEVHDCVLLNKPDMVNVYIPSDPHLCLCLSKMYDDDALSDSQFYELCVEQLKRAGEYTHALALADGGVQHRHEIVEVLLEALVKEGRSGASIAQYIKRMRNHVHAAQLTLEHLERFDADTAIDLLYMCAFQLEDDDAEHALINLQHEIGESLTRLRLYKSIIVVNSTTFVSWQEVSRMCTEHPVEIARKMIALQEHQLVARIMAQFSLGDGKNLVQIEFETSYILELLTKFKNKPKAFERLEALPPYESALVCKKVMDQIDDHRTKLILVQFLIRLLEKADSDSVEDFKDGAITIESLSVVELSLNILVRLPHDLQRNMRHLIGKPSLLVESLLMDCHISLVRDLISVYPTLLDNNMIFVAAQNALSLKGTYYENTPNMVLAFGNDEANVRFGVESLGTGSVGLVKQCDAYLGCCNLLRVMQSMKGSYRSDDPFFILLTDMSDPARMRALRDALITPQIDRIRLALDVCQTCRIEEEPVHAAWGLALVRMGEFREARVKFAACLPKLPSDRVNMFVREIVSIIKNNALHPCGMEDITDRHVDSSFIVMSEGIWSSKPMDTLALTNKQMDSSASKKEGNLSPELRSECLHYIETYSVAHGGSKDLVKFYISQSLVKEACLCVVAQRLPKSIFVEIVVRSSVDKGHTSELIKILERIDASLTVVRPYLQGMCQWLHRQERHHLLLVTQVLMKDHIGAAFTCERLFDAAHGFDERMEHLRQVNDHFTAALSQSAKVRISALSLECAKEIGIKDFASNETAIRRRILLVGLQMAVLKLLPATRTPALIAVGVAAESEDERQSQKERQDETLGMVKKIDPRLWTELSRALGR
eukprot:g4972.t1